MRLVTLRTALLALAGCQASSGGNSTAEANLAAPAAAPAPPAKRVAATPATGCAPVPDLALSQDFSDPRELFQADDSKPFAQLRKNFAAAYAKACASGVLRGHPLVERGVPHPRTIYVINAPDSNVASFYRQAKDAANPADMVLEYHFVTSDGVAQVPSADDLGEAIYCAVHGASAKEEEESGRCLAD
jgi:hypothetical protein